MKLVYVYPVGIEASEALFAGLADEIGLEVLGFLLVTDTGGKGVEVVADLCTEDDIVALALEGLGYDFLVGA